MSIKKLLQFGAAAGVVTAGGCGVYQPAGRIGVDENAALVSLSPLRDVDVLFLPSTATPDGQIYVPQNIRLVRGADGRIEMDYLERAVSPTESNVDGVRYPERHISSGRLHYSMGIVGEAVAHRTHDFDFIVDFFVIRVAPEDRIPLLETMVEQTQNLIDVGESFPQRAYYEVYKASNPTIRPQQNVNLVRYNDVNPLSGDEALAALKTYLQIYQDALVEIQGERGFSRPQAPEIPRPVMPMPSPQSANPATSDISGSIAQAFFRRDRASL